MSYRSQLLVVLGLATVVTAACDEFPEPLESDSGLIPIVIQPVDWPAEVALGGSATLEVTVQDREGRALVDVPVSWALLTESAGQLQDVGGSNGSQQTLAGTSLGWAHISVSVTGQEPFADQTFVDSIPILLAGVQIDAPTADTTLTALGDQLVLSAAGLSLGGNAVPATGLEWLLVSGDAVSPVSTVQADQVTIQAVGEGTAVIAATHTRCVSTSPCADTVRVTVDQLADSVALNSRADTLVADDTVQLRSEVYDANGNNAPNETVTWLSRSPAVATVDNTGLVTARGSGETQIVASASTGAADSATVTVNASGTITVDLTDAPADLLASAQLFLGGVFVIDNVVNDGRRYLLDTSFSVDLLTLADTVAVLAGGRVPAGTYNNLILDVDSARITLQDSVTFSDLTRTRTLILPQDTVVAAINGTAAVADNDTVRVVLDFDVDGSFPLDEPVGGVVNEPTFTPTTRVVKRTEAASISGSLGTTGTADTTGVAVRAVRTDVAGDTVFARSDLAGDYKLRYLAPGSYDVSIPRPPACHVPTPTLQSLAVTAGQAATGNNFSIDPVTIDSLATIPGVDTVNAIGFTTTLSATAYQGATPLTGLRVDWTSADPTIATVSPNGVVTAVASGLARIVATACGSTDTALVTVRQVPNLITISPDAPQVEAGGTVQFSATLEDSNGVSIDTAAFQYSSSDTTIATIDPASGLAAALKSGATVIEAFHPASGLFDNTELNVLLAPTTSFSANTTNGCALTTIGQVVCWGPNPHGILGFAPISDNFGNPDWYTAYKPQEIGLPTTETYTQVSVGEGHACALTAGGDIYCWGSGGSGELGNGSNFDSHTPVLVQRPVGEVFNDVAAGHWFTCGNTESGQAYCWGDNWAGQLGNGTTTPTNSPQPVSQVTGLVFYDLTVEERTVCAIGTNDAGFCWGEGQRGELGNGNANDSSTPVGVVMPATTFTQLVASTEGFCALGANGLAYCWGNDAFSLNGGNDMLTPQQLGTETFVGLGKANNTLCGVTGTGQVRCTGGNYVGQFGNGTIDRGPALFENGATGVTATALDGAGWDTMCGLDAGGKVMCWGWKDMGLTGTGDRSYTADPIQVSGPAYTAVTSNWDETCGLTDTNQIYCWGFSVGSFNGDFSYPKLTPQLVTPPPAGVLFADIEKGVNHMCALTTGGEVFCLGENYAGQLGDGTYDNSVTAWVEVAHPAGGTWAEITSGRAYNCALDTDGDVYCWGFNGNGQLGAGPGTAGQGAYFPDPTLTSDVGQVYTSVSAASYHTCATTNSSTIFCWGWNGRGQLGNGDYTDRDTPTQVSSVQFFDRVDAGHNHTCALTFGGEAFCWGESGSGQIGDDYASADPATPVAVLGGFTYEWIEAGDSRTCARTGTGETLCWGTNWAGQAGVGYFGNDPAQPGPAAFAGLDLVDLSTLNETTCAVDSFGALYCLGSHNHGATGVGLNAYEVLPVEVGGSGGN